MTEKIKTLNLYAGIGGNRKYWDNVEVTAIELNPDIAKIYQDFFPNDKVIVTDAHQYLLEHYNEFDFIWSSPPCPSHSKIRNMGAKSGYYNPIFPNLALYEEIIFLKSYCKNKYCVENVIPYYEPLIQPQVLERHCFWANFNISKFEPNLKRPVNHSKITGTTKVYDIDLTGKTTGKRKDQVLRNMVNPELGLHIFNCAFPDKHIHIKDYYKQEVLI